MAVNAFNRTQNLNYLYMSVFKPATSYRWLGNIKKYRITPSGQIRDANDNAAVDPNTGFFVTGAQSYWSDMADGADAELGGAAGELKTPATRKIYSNLTANSGTLTEDLSELKATGNLTLANLLLLGVVSNVAVSGRPAVGELVDWAYGHDVQDENGNSDFTEARKDMGDPLHSRPATVIYGGPADDPDITLYATTNDGYFQAINAKTGAELWAFVPRLMLDRIEELYTNDDVTSRTYGLDGVVRVVRLDRNGNGTIEPAGTDIDGSGSVTESEKDKVYLYFGMRRGGSQLLRPRRDQCAPRRSCCGSSAPPTCRASARPGPHPRSRASTSTAPGPAATPTRWCSCSAAATTSSRTLSATWRTAWATASSWWTPSPAA